jgi:hypothetical protein
MLLVTMLKAVNTPRIVVVVVVVVVVVARSTSSFPMLASLSFSLASDSPTRSRQFCLGWHQKVRRGESRVIARKSE